MPTELWGLTPREVAMIAKAFGRRVFDNARRERRETAIICTYIANTFSSHHVTFNSIYSKMEIKDPEAKPKVQIYKGTLVEQLEQHAEKLREEGKLPAEPKIKIYRG